MDSGQLILSNLVNLEVVDLVMKQFLRKFLITQNTTP